jgi:hypothetical protein
MVGAGKKFENRPRRPARTFSFLFSITELRISNRKIMTTVDPMLGYKTTGDSEIAAAVVPVV